MPNDRDAVDISGTTEREKPAVNTVKRQELDSRYAVLENGVEQLVLDEDGAVIEFR